MIARSGLDRCIRHSHTREDNRCIFGREQGHSEKIVEVVHGGSGDDDIDGITINVVDRKGVHIDPKWFEGNKRQRRASMQEHERAQAVRASAWPSHYRTDCYRMLSAG